MRWRIVGIVVGVVVLGLVVAALTLRPAVAHGQGGKVLELTGGGGPTETIDLGKKGPSPGDLFIGRIDMLENGKKVGIARFECVTTPRNSFMCTNHVHLFDRGQIIDHSSARFGKPVFVGPVTGGTGEFVGARGQTTADFSDPAVPKITIELLP